MNKNGSISDDSPLSSLDLIEEVDPGTEDSGTFNSNTDLELRDSEEGLPLQKWPHVQAILPNKPSFEINLIGFDSDFYGYFQILDIPTWDKYATHLAQMTMEYRGKGNAKMVPSRNLFLGMYVIVQVNDSFYVRAMVAEIKGSNPLITCFNLDEMDEFVTSKERIFYPSEQAMSLPFRAVKFEVESLINWESKDEINAIIKKMEKEGCRFFATFVDWVGRLPLIAVQVLNPNGEQTTLDQSMISISNPKG